MNPVCVVLLRRLSRSWPAPRQPARAESGVQPQHWVEGRRHRTGPGSDELPRQRRTGLVGDNQTDPDRGTALIILADGVAAERALELGRVLDRPGARHPRPRAPA